MHDVLFVDDDQNLLQGLARNLRGLCRVHTAVGGDEALKVLQNGLRPAVVVTDMRMPGTDGIAFLKKLKGITPAAIRVMLTGNADQATAVQAVNEGSVFRFVCKPCTKEEMTAVLDAAIRQYQLVAAEKQLLEGTLLGAIGLLTQALTLADAALFDLCQRAKEMIGQLAPLYPANDRWALESAALLAPIGMITVPPVVAARSRRGHKLTDAENEILSRVPEIGHDLLVRIPRLESVAQVIRYQNKNFDGTGMPRDALAKEQIPLGSRLLAIVRGALEQIDEGLDIDSAFRTMQGQLGRYDPELLTKAREALRPTWAAGATDTGKRGVQMNALAVGMVLAEPVMNAEGTVLVGKGQAISLPLLERLNNFARTIGVQEPIMIVAADKPATTPS